MHCAEVSHHGAKSALEGAGVLSLPLNSTAKCHLSLSIRREIVAWGAARDRRVAEEERLKKEVSCGVVELARDCLE